MKSRRISIGIIATAILVGAIAAYALPVLDRQEFKDEVQFDALVKFNSTVKMGTVTSDVANLTSANIVTITNTTLKGSAITASTLTNNVANMTSANIVTLTNTTLAGSAITASTITGNVANLTSANIPTLTNTTAVITTLGVSGVSTLARFATTGIGPELGVALTATNLVAANYGKALLVATNGAIAITLPANGAAAGSWIDVFVYSTATDDCAPTIAAATADTLIGPNDVDLKSVTWGTGHRIGAQARFWSDGALWHVQNLGGTTMTYTD